MSQIAKNQVISGTVTALAVFATIDVRQQENVCISFVVGVANLTDFLIEARATDGSGQWFTIATATGDFTTPVFPVLKASGDLNAAAFGATVHFVWLNCKALQTIRLSAQGAASTITGVAGGM